MVWYGMVWYGMVWYGMVWYGMVWYGMVWYGIRAMVIKADHKRVGNIVTKAQVTNVSILHTKRNIRFQSNSVCHFNLLKCVKAEWY